jgi:hypothetical protein
LPSGKFWKLRLARGWRDGRAWRALERLILLSVQSLVSYSRRDSIHSVILAHGMRSASPKLDLPVFSTTSLVILLATIFQIKIRT